METDFDTALRFVRASNFRVGPEWQKAHAIAQAHEGERAFDALHALLHRIEGDVSNAAYWDRRAGTVYGGQGHEVEVERVAALRP